MVVIAKTSSMLNAIKECRVGHPLYAHTYTHTHTKFTSNLPPTPGEDRPSLWPHSPALVALMEKTLW